MIKTNTGEIVKDIFLKGLGNELNVIFFLEDNQYGYGYTYESDNEEEPFQSMNYVDRFTEEEITSENFDEMLGAENRTAYCGSFNTSGEAVTDVLNYWSGIHKVGKIDTNIDSYKEAARIGRKEKLDYIIF